MIREYCDISANGDHLSRWLDALRQSPIVCGEQRVKGDSFRCRIPACELDAFRALADAHGMHLHVHQKRTILTRLRAYRLRIGLPVGMLLAVVLILWQSNSVTTIEVQKNEVVAPETVLAVLEEMGVRRGTWIPGIDRYRCECAIRRAIPETCWVGIRPTGSRLIVEVAEEKPHVSMLSERMPCDIVSDKDAVITDITVDFGMLLHLVGDTVPRGETLVTGVLSDDAGHTRLRHAKATVTGIYTRSFELTEYLTKETRQRTGRAVRQRWLRVLGMALPLSWERPSYAISTVHEEEAGLSFLGRPLPLSIVTRTTEEVAVMQTTRTLDELHDAINSDILRFEKDALADVTILDRDLVYEETPDALTCHLTYTVEGEIGVERDILHE